MKIELFDFFLNLDLLKFMYLRFSGEKVRGSHPLSKV